MHKKACKQKDGGANKKNDGELRDKQALGQTCVHPNMRGQGFTCRQGAFRHAHRASRSRNNIRAKVR